MHKYCLENVNNCNPMMSHAFIDICTDGYSDVIHFFYLQVILAIILVLMGEIFALIDFFSFTAWFFYGLTMASLIVLRCTQKERQRPYKVSRVHKEGLRVLIIFAHLSK